MAPVTLGIPVIDVGPCFADVPGALEASAADVRDTLENVGFFVMVNHGDRTDEGSVAVRASGSDPVAFVIPGDNAR